MIDAAEISSLSALTILTSPARDIGFRWKMDCCQSLAEMNQSRQVTTPRPQRSIDRLYFASLFRYRRPLSTTTSA